MDDAGNLLGPCFKRKRDIKYMQFYKSSKKMALLKCLLVILKICVFCMLIILTVCDNLFVDTL